MFFIGHASTSLWTIYCMLNAVSKAKYGFNLRDFPRVTNLIKTFNVDMKKKAMVFSKEDIDRFITDPQLSTPYWIV